MQDLSYVGELSLSEGLILMMCWQQSHLNELCLDLNNFLPGDIAFFQMESSLSHPSSYQT